MDYIDLKKLTVDELVGVINIYPWFAGARLELCERVSQMGQDWNESQFAEASLYVPSRRRLARMFRGTDKVACADEDAEKIIKSFLEEKHAEEYPKYERKVIVAGGDYFSQSQYERVSREDDGVFSKYASQFKAEKADSDPSTAIDYEIYTETLAEIYLEQGYPEQAKHIYSKLILAYPEKSAYFAGLIQKIEEINSI